MRFTWLAASIVGISRAQSDIVVAQPAAASSDDGMIFTSDGESHQISYLDREFADDDGKFG